MARLPLFSGEMREILPRITEATNQRNIFDSRHSLFSGSSHDISTADFCLHNQKILEVTHETTITALDLSCHCQTKAENNYEDLDTDHNTEAIISKT
jgi:hypothetical protein